MSVQVGDWQVKGIDPNYSGLDLVAVQRLAGHKDATTTLRIYAHAWERAQRSQDIRAKMATGGLVLSAVAS